MSLRPCERGCGRDVRTGLVRPGVGVHGQRLADGRMCSVCRVKEAATDKVRVSPRPVAEIAYRLSLGMIDALKQLHVLGSMEVTTRTLPGRYVGGQVAKALRSRLLVTREADFYVKLTPEGTKVAKALVENTGEIFIPE